MLSEETVVREAAANSFHLISEDFSEDSVQKYVVPLITKLFEQENFTGKTSSCYMIRPIYSRAGKEKEKLRTYYGKLCEDETPLLKKAAAKELGPLSQVFEREFVNSDMVTYLKKFMTDQDYIKVICLDSLQELVKIFNETSQQRVNVSIIVQASEDKSWKIRNQMAKIFPNLIEGLGNQVNELLPSYANLIKDSEMEVRISALEGLAKIISNVSAEKLISAIVPAIVSLNAESHIEVKSELIT